LSASIVSLSHVKFLIENLSQSNIPASILSARNVPLILAAFTVNPVCLFRLPINVPSDPVKSILSALIFKSVSPLFTSFVIPSITPVASSSVVIVLAAI